MTAAPDDRSAAALDDCRLAVDELDRLCCEPGRSPRMAELAATIHAARIAIERIVDDPGAVDRVLALLEDAGGQTGRLQVGCCAPVRLPLYSRILDGLTTTRTIVARVSGRGH